MRPVEERDYLRMEEQGIFPRPEEITTDSLKGMPPEAWNVVITFLASFPTGEITFKNGYLPSPAMRARAAAVAEKALGLWHAENIDEVRAKLGNQAKGLNLNFPLEEFVERTRMTLFTGAMEQAEALAKDGELPEELAWIPSQFEMDELAATTKHDPEAWRGDDAS